MAEDKRLRFAILGAGGIGGYYGGKLARAGYPVSILARGNNLAALRQKLEVRAEGQTWSVQIEASDRVEDFGPIDCAVVAVKTYSLPEIAESTKYLAERGAVILPLLNGVDVVDKLIQLNVPQKQILGGLTAISAVKAAPGVFELNSSFQRVTLGEMPTSSRGQLAEQAERIAQAFRESGVDAEVTNDIVTEIWRKFTFIASGAAVCGLAHASIGVLRERPLGKLLIERALREVVAVAKSQGVTFREDEVQRMLGFIDNLPAGMKPSFLLDLESGGRTELDDLSGAVSRIGRQGNVETPIHDTAVAALAGY
ncbi:MAG TPA: 2-dehydropantoate 2-reductase [Blastocatellia bacterium]|nr:2-dehydropantoate 2-reductase [Blastocatellia bacterium]